MRSMLMNVANQYRTGLVVGRRFADAAPDPRNPERARCPSCDNPLPTAATASTVRCPCGVTISVPSRSALRKAALDRIIGGRR